MADWWETPYALKKPVPVPGFPRPLYPPDAADKGKTPSIDGPDIEAIKRTVSRLARWPWQTFDEAFSNAFSHGKAGGAVADSGVAGFQRQMGISDTGWIGSSTFDKLRAAIIPDGLPHAGEYGMDVTARNLIAEAWTMFGGKPTTPPEAEKTTRERALAGAIKWIGTKESPRGSNHTQFGQWYGVDYQPWCAIFATYCFVIEADGSPSFARGSRYAYVPYIVSDARNGLHGLSVPSSPMPGDLACFDWHRDGTYDHVGLFERFSGSSPSTFTCIEGNTSVGNDSNGGQVMRRDRDTRHQNTVFVRVREP